MRGYVPKSCNLPRWAYKIVLETVRGYDDMIRQMKENEYEILHSTPSAIHFQGGDSKFAQNGVKPITGMENASAPHYRSVGHISRPTEDKAFKIMNVNKQRERMTRAVEQAMICFPEDEREIILNHINRDAPLHRDGIKGADRTMERRKQGFIYLVAQNLNLI
jgi:hypothetical protein